MASERVLMVEDEPEIRDFVAVLLGSEGYQVTTAPNGAVVLERVSGETFDLVLSRQIVELHRGRIDVTFPVDGGSRFVVQLPVTERDASPTFSPPGTASLKSRSAALANTAVLASQRG